MIYKAPKSQKESGRIRKNQGTLYHAVHVIRVFYESACQLVFNHHIRHSSITEKFMQDKLTREKTQ